MIPEGFSAFCSVCCAGLCLAEGLRELHIVARGAVWLHEGDLLTAHTGRHVHAMRAWLHETDALMTHAGLVLYMVLCGLMRETQYTASHCMALQYMRGFMREIR